MDIAHSWNLSYDAGVAFQIDLYRIAAKLRFDLAHAAIDDLFPARDHANVIAELFRLLHDMGRKENGFALLLEFEEDVLDQFNIEGV